MMSIIGALLSEVGAKAIVDNVFPKMVGSLKGVLASEAGKAGTRAAEGWVRVHFKKEEWRHALHHFLEVSMPASKVGYPHEAEYLLDLIRRMARCEEGFKPGDEDTFSTILAEHLAYLVKPGGYVEREEHLPLDDLIEELPEKEQERIFTAFARISQRLEEAEKRARVAGEEFSPFNVLAVLKDDHLQQLIRRAWAELQPHLQEVKTVAETAIDEHRRAKSALFMLALLGVIFMVLYSTIEVVPLGAAEPFAYVGMFGLLMAGALYVWWKASILTIALAAFNVTRPLVQVAFMVLSLAVVLLIVGIFVPTHEAALPLQAAAVIAFIGLAFVGVWAGVSGVKPIFTPQIAGFVLVGVLLVTALNGFDQQTDGAVGEFFSSAKDQVGEMLDEGPSWANRAEAAEVPQLGTHAVGVCEEPRIIREGAGEIILDAQPSCWSELIVIPETARQYGSRNSAGECIEFFFPDLTGTVLVGGERGVIQNGCEDSQRARRGIFRVRTEARDAEVVIYYR